MDFLKIKKRMAKDGHFIIEPEFTVGISSDLMTRGKAFYAVYDETNGFWSTDEFKAVSLIDDELLKAAEEVNSPLGVEVKRLNDYSSGSYEMFLKYLKALPNSYHELDTKVTFLGEEVKKESYASKHLDYAMGPGDISGYEELMSTLYDPEDRQKLEWSIGAIIAGDAKDIQKFVVLYGKPGSGKSTVLRIIEQLFKGYWVPFEARELVTGNNSFGMEQFRSNPLVAIQHDGDLSRIEDNTRFNSLISHENMLINEKYKQAYSARFNSFLFLASNKPVRITDAKSGLIRRLINVNPSGRKLNPTRYEHLMRKIQFELGAIADKCLNVYKSLGFHFYDSYIATEMIFKTNNLYNFVDVYYDDFKNAEYITLSDAYELYKKYCDDALVEFKLPRYKFREEFKDYFKGFEERYWDGTKQVRSCFMDFDEELFKSETLLKKDLEDDSWIKMTTEGNSPFDVEFEGCKAQYASKYETPKIAWDDCQTKLMDIDTHELHYVKVPENLIVVDFDLKNENGEKDYDLNFSAAGNFPPTYCEVSKGGSGLHLHYFYDGDISKLSSVYDEGIEVKLFTGKSSLRRKLTKFVPLAIATISSGLPMKGEKKMIDFEGVKSEKALRTLILKNLAKEYHPGTKPSIDFIYKILDDAYNQGLRYDVSDLQPRVLAFANNSTNHAEYCIEKYMDMKFKSDEPSEVSDDEYEDDLIVFYDVEVFPNLFVIVYKAEGKPCVRLINPSPLDVEKLCKFKLVGFNNRRYDNHILYARMLGYSNEQLYNLSQRIVNSSKYNSDGLFGEAYNLSYADVYDFAAKKQGLKKWEIELDIHHQELGLPWDEPVPEDMWDLVAEYCENDVVATEAVFLNRSADFTARKILADLSGLSVNDTNRSHIIKILVGNDRNPELVYTDLSELFPGYEFVQDEKGKWHNMYRGTDVGFGGYVYAEPGMYKDVALLDVGNMHGASIILLNKFGPYTKNYAEIREARMYIKHKEFDKAKGMLNGVLEKYLDDESKAHDLEQALKLVLNSTYGIAAATFKNPLRDERDLNNIIALRGALFMRTLQDEVVKRGFQVIHIKTDSIKIPEATQEIIDFVIDFGKQYGYDFEHEATYSRLCLVNNAVYVAKYKDEKEHEYELSTGQKVMSSWTATGKQFQIPYVFKAMFSKDEIVLKDYAVTMESKTGPIYIDMNEDLGEDEHNYRFVGNVGCFVPIREKCGGGELKVKRDDKYVFPPGAKDHRWLEYETVKELNKNDDVDKQYFRDMVSEAVHDISEYGDFEWFIGEDNEPEDDFMNVPEGEDGYLPFGNPEEIPWDTSDGLTKVVEKGEEDG